MANDYFNIEDELVDYAEVSGFNLETGGYIKDINLLNNNLLKEKNTIDILNMVKSVFVKKEVTI